MLLPLLRLTPHQRTASRQKRGSSLLGVAEHAPHRIKQINWQTKAISEGDRQATVRSEKAAQLKFDQA
jgi:hypothetical protein